jgi:hypothetical protein
VNVNRTMRRVLVLVGLLAVTIIGVDHIADATQTREDVRHGDQATEVVIDLDAQNYRQPLATGANALWATCSATVAGNLTDDGIVDQGNGRFRFAVHPSLGEHGKERLLGCVRDLTVERLRAHLVSVHDVAYEPALG